MNESANRSIGRSLKQSTMSSQSINLSNAGFLMEMAVSRQTLRGVVLLQSCEKQETWLQIMADSIVGCSGKGPAKI